MQVSSWGRLGQWPHDIVALRDRDQRSLPRVGGRKGLPYGMGRSYGDVCLNPGGTLWPMRGLDHFIAWDPDRQSISCEAGTLLRDIQRLMVPRGWMLPVTPGTQLVTVGGAIANDVHGKNHHVHGTFGDQVERLHLLRSDGEIIECGPGLNEAWFEATVGGLGLTGVITWATLRLRPVQGPWLDAETLPYNSLAEFAALAEASESGWEHTVSWIDCLGGAHSRGLFQRANMSPRPGGEAEAQAGEGGARKVPFTPPVSLVNRLSLRPFNAAYYQLGKWQAGHRQVHYEPFFYPLDKLLEWNRIYGPKGFYQYQCVVPREGGLEAIQSMLGEIARSGQGSFLGVLKMFGERRARGFLSFARPGFTLALDFPNLGTPSLALFSRLDAIVKQACGCLYPAKDARMPKDVFEAGFPRLTEFMRFRDPGISSAFSRRTMGS